MHSKQESDNAKRWAPPLPRQEAVLQGIIPGKDRRQGWVCGQRQAGHSSW